MQIDDDHLYHGAALIQIAEHPDFTAINSLKIGGKIVRSGYKINDNIAVYLKYASKPSKTYGEYSFTFHEKHRQELDKIAQSNEKTFIGLVCVKDCEICLLSHQQLKNMEKAREAALGKPEESLVILITAPPGKKLRAYVNAPGQRKKILGSELLISRSAFPEELFG